MISVAELLSRFPDLPYLDVDFSDPEADEPLPAGFRLLSAEEWPEFGHHDQP